LNRKEVVHQYSFFYTTILKRGCQQPLSLFPILKSEVAPARGKAIAAFTVQLILNFFWSIIFFRFHAVGIALVEIVLMWATILWMIVAMHRVNKFALLIQIPCIAWVSFASILNAAIFYLN